MGVDELNPQLALLEDIVKPFLPTNYKFRYALNASREIVNGFKYEIIFAVEDENNLEIICSMDVLEKPWLLKDSNKYRKMTYNNCSLINMSDEDDKIKNTFQINPVFHNQRVNVTSEDLIDMEEQIIPIGSNRRVIATSRGTRPTTTTTTTTEMPESSTEPLNTNSKNLLDDFFNMNNYFPPPPNPITTTSTSTTTTTTTTSQPPISNFNLDALDEMFGIKKVAQVNQMPPKANDAVDGSGEEAVEEKKVNLQETSVTDNEEALKELEMEIKKTFSELFQSDPDFQTNIIALINRKNDETALKNYNFVINILASKLKDKIEDYNERNVARQEVDPTIVTSSDVNENHYQGGNRRRKRSTEATKRIWNLAEQAVDKLDYYDEDDHKRVLLDIIDVKESLESDELYTIKAIIANSRCLESSNENVHCIKKIDEMTKKLCLFEVNQKCLTI